MRQKVVTLLAISLLIPGLVGADTGRSKGAPSPPVAVPVSPPAKGTPRRPAQVSRVSIQRGVAGVETSIDVTTNRPTAYRVHRFTDPERLVLDFEEAVDFTHQRVVLSDSPLLKGVRVGQFRDNDPAVVRVVADLISDPAFDVHSIPGGVRIELRSRHQVATAVVPENVPGTRPSQSPARTEARPAQLAMTEAAQRSRRNRNPGRAQAESTSVAPRVESAKAETSVPPAEDYHNALPGAIDREVTAAPRPVPPNQQAPEPAPTVKPVESVAAAPHPVPESLQAQAPASASTLGVPEKPKYTGEPISLNLKDVDLKDFFRLVHEISGLNIIVDPNVSGSVTMVLDAVPWDQALDIVLKNNRLDKTLEGNVLRIAKVETLSAEQEATAKLAAAREEAQPLVTVFRPVNYAKASAISTMLKNWVGGALSKRGTILVDDRTNTLIISDIQAQIPVIQSIIAKLDTKTKQVVIEARIILATASFQRTLSAALSAGTVNRSTSLVTGGSTGTGASVTPNIVPPPRLTIGQTSASGFGAYAISNASSRYFLNAAIAAAETKSQAKTISRPTIITQNNIPGKVQQGAQIPIQTSINNTISIQYIAATLSLNVTPQVTEAGDIFMIIDVQNASPGPALTNAGPSINTQSATTQVLVPDGGTVVFGGITVTQRTKSATYVPLLGNIPVLGNLFKSSNVQDSDNELLFFVSPKVLAT